MCIFGRHSLSHLRPPSFPFPVWMGRAVWNWLVSYVNPIFPSFTLSQQPHNYTTTWWQKSIAFLFETTEMKKRGGGEGNVEKCVELKDQGGKAKTRRSSSQTSVTSQFHPASSSSFFFSISFVYSSTYFIIYIDSHVASKLDTFLTYFKISNVKFYFDRLPAHLIYVWPAPPHKSPAFCPYFPPKYRSPAFLFFSKFFPVFPVFFNVPLSHVLPGCPITVWSRVGFFF